MFDFSWTFCGVNTDFFLNFSDIFLISQTLDPSVFLLNHAVRTVHRLALGPPGNCPACTYVKMALCVVNLDFVFSMVNSMHILVEFIEIILPKEPYFILFPHLQPSWISEQHLKHNGDVYSKKHYVIKFVGDLWQVCGFLWVLQFPPPIKLTTMI